MLQNKLTLQLPTLRNQPNLLMNTEFSRSKRNKDDEHGLGVVKHER